MPKKHVNLTLAALVATLTLAAGCSSDDAATSSGEAGSTTAASSDQSSLWTGPTPNTDPMSDQDAAAIDTAATESLAANAGQVPGMWIGVWDTDTGTYQGAYGEAELAATPAATDDHLRIGSVTKTFTAAAVLQQIDEGTISLDDTISDVLPDLAASHEDVADITVDQLLSMTSGIPDYANTDILLPTVVEDPTRVWTPEEIIELTLTEEPLAEPGTPGYSTTNYLILGEMLEAVTGSPIDEIVTGVAAEVGLTQSALTEPEDNEIPDPATHGYVFDAGAASLAQSGATVEPGTDVTDWSASWGGAGGSMYSTVEDLGAWAASGFGNTLLTEDTATERMETELLPDVGLGYGQGIIAFGDTAWIGHSGQIIGWETIAAYNTQTGDVFVGLINETGSLSTVMIPVLAGIYPDLAALFA